MNAHKNYKDDALTADWLRDIGLNDKTFNTAKLNVVRAQTMAHTLLTQHRALLSNSQLHSLTAFEQACGNKRERQRICVASACPATTQTQPRLCVSVLQVACP